ncbi:hypothetical protein AB205_0182290 [Aquarana catesbeiana]|uniref:Integrase SAM-like N-terminal domain-containing protein n=1 Tax=Aquarana catesbeiana TaxID=8400 RepID=A0A2G9QBG6_AQUCT|nr:hypothetical protein AB205_0182290 [Aquarana catesbeiana]
MRKAGLYQRNSLNALMLKEFATYLHETLEIENYKQEVEDVARFLYFMNPKRANLNFVKKFIYFTYVLNALKHHLKNQTISGYMKHIRRFVRYQLKATNLSVQDPELFQHCTFFMNVTDDMLKRITKLASRENVGKR